MKRTMTEKENRIYTAVLVVVGVVQLGLFFKNHFLPESNLKVKKGKGKAKQKKSMSKKAR